MWEQLNRIIKPNGAIVLFGSEPFSSALRMSNIKNYQCDWVWHKSKPTGVAFKTQPMRNHEIISIFNKPKTFNSILEDRVGFTKKSIKRFKDAERLGVQTLGTYRNTKNSTTDMPVTDKKKMNLKRKPTSIKMFGSVPNRLGSLHPTQKPVALMEYLIKTYTNENETVLDFTMGSGSTGVAAKNTNRNFIGIEMDENYFNIASDRIKQLEYKLF